MMWFFIALPAGFQALLVLRLVSTGLVKRYPALAAWMAFSAISMVALLGFSGPSAPGYRSAWIARQLVGMIVLFAAMVELTNRILEHYPGLRKVTASALFGLVLATSLVATAGEDLAKPVKFLLMMQTGWNAATSLYVIILVALATYLDPRRRKNVILYERVFAASCTLSATFSLLMALRYTPPHVSDVVGAIGGVVFPLLWMKMNRAGEVDQRPPAQRVAGQTSLADAHARLERLERMVTRSGD